jgi:superfamily II DNA/RNA helicase
MPEIRQIFFQFKSIRDLRRGRRHQAPGGINNSIMSNNALNGTADVNTDHSFEQLCLPPLILQGALRAGYLRPSPVQYQSIPPGRSGCDLIVQAKAGTGKTFAFAAIVLEHIDLNNPSPQVCCSFFDTLSVSEFCLFIRDSIRR